MPVGPCANERINQRQAILGGKQRLRVRHRTKAGAKDEQCYQKDWQPEGTAVRAQLSRRIHRSCLLHLSGPMEIRVPPLIGPVPGSWRGRRSKRSNIFSKTLVCGLHPGRSPLSCPDRRRPQGHARRAKIPGTIPCLPCAAPSSFCAVSAPGFGFAPTADSGEMYGGIPDP